MSRLTLLDDDLDRYHDVYRNGFSKIAKKDVVLKEVAQHFDNIVLKKMTDVFQAEDQFNLLGVGVGEGHCEFHFLKRLGSHFRSIKNVAVEPNESLFKVFKAETQSWSSDTESNCESHYFVGPLTQFFDESPLVDRKYNLISAVHSLYYTGDLEATFIRLMSMLKDDGVMVIVLAGPNLIYRTHHRNPWLPAFDRYSATPESLKVVQLAEREGYKVTEFELNTKWDVTALFEEKSELGDKLVDFLTMTAYFRKTAPAGKLEEFMRLWRESCSEGENGRLQTEPREKLFFITK
nr:histamine N-methyltransferase-like [Lytechinus pictus]